MGYEKGEAKAAKFLFHFAGIKVETVRSSTGDIACLVDYIPNLTQYGLGWVPGVLLRGSVWSIPGNFLQAVLAVFWCFVVSQIYSQDCDSPAPAAASSSDPYGGRRLVGCTKMVSPGPY